MSGASDSDSVLRRLDASGRSAPRLVLAGGDDAPAAPPLRTSSRYEVVGEIARGGVGVILRGRDVDLGRDVAMKVLREDHVGSADLVRRFVEEAQVGGQLQHPGIVPVYELGLRPDGRPFFAMKLIKGGTLAAALATRKGPDDDRRRFLAVFERACQTIAYAHSRGVIHRDLKPSNVMIGAFGEVQVVDWGFAKVLAAGGVADEKRAKRATKGATVVATVRSGSSGSTSVAGSVMGTPAYMPPEQALGYVEHVDERSDVFALGAILCEVLTGRPPYVGEDLLGQARRCLLDDAKRRLDACGADDPLVKLARACLAALPKDRPKHAGEVASAVAAHLAEADERAHRSKLHAIEAKSKAEKARAAAEAARAEATERTRARRQTRAIAAAVIVAVIAAGGVWTRLEARRAGRERATVAAVDEALQDATRLAAAEDWTSALAAADRARDLAATGDSAADVVARTEALLANVKAKEASARDAAAQREKDAAFIAKLEELRGLRSETRDYVRWDAQVAEAFQDYGIDAERTPTDEASRRIRGRGDSVAARVAMALDEWAMTRRVKRQLADRDASRLDALARALDDDEWRSRLRDAVASGDRDVLREMARHPDVVAQPASTIALLAAALGHRAGSDDRVDPRGPGDLAAAADLLRRAHFRHAGDYWVNHQLAICLLWMDAASKREAVRYATAARALSPASVLAANTVAVSHIESGSPETARYLLEREITRHPDEELLRNSLGTACYRLGDLAAAEAAFRDALRLAPGDAISRINLIGVQLERGGSDDALRDARAFVASAPTENLAHAALAGVLEQRGDRGGAIDAYRRASQCAESQGYTWEAARSLADLSHLLCMERQFPAALEAASHAVELDRYSGRARFKLGYVQAKLGDWRDALASFAKALELGLSSKADEASGWNNIGLVHSKAPDHEQAESAFLRAIELNPLDAEPRNNLGVILYEQGRLDDALTQFRAALLAEPRRAAVSHRGIGLCLRQKGERDAELDAFRRCVEADPKFVKGWINLGTSLRARADYDDAEAAYRTALALTPDDQDASNAHDGVGCVAVSRWQIDDALAAFGRAVELSPANGEAQHHLGYVLFQTGRIEDAIAPLRAAVDCLPEACEPAHGLGHVLVEAGDFAEALRWFREAARLGTIHSEVLHSGGVESHLAYVERLIELEDSLDAVVAGKQNPKDGVDAFDYASLCVIRARFLAAARLAKQALALDPKLGDKLGDDPSKSVRVRGACGAVLAAAGEGDDADALNPKEREAWRKQALEWMLAQLALRRRLAETAGADAETVSASLWAYVLFTHDPDFASVREPAKLAKLPADERQAWRAFWKDVDAAFEKAKAVALTLAPR